MSGVEKGRSAWYNAQGETKQPFVIGVSGGLRWVVTISLDSFYRPLTPEQRLHVSDYNFDHPDAFDVPLLIDTLTRLRAGESVDIPQYDFKTHSRLPQPQHLYGADVILVEGILVFYWPALRALMDLRVYVEEDSDVRLARRLRRDIAERGRALAGVLAQYERTVKPSHDEFCAPSRKHADVVVPRGVANPVALELLTTAIARRLLQRGIWRDLRAQLAQCGPGRPANVRTYSLGPGERGLLTRLRDWQCSRDDFVFYSDRLSRLLLEWVLAEQAWQPKHVITPTGAAYAGLALARPLLVCSIMRAGEAMEAPLAQIMRPPPPLVKILIQSSAKDPRYLYSDRFPPDAAQRTVFILDPMLGTGATAMMATRLVLDHGVPQENISLLCLVAAPEGMHVLSHAFPRMSIWIMEVDAGLSAPDYYIVPGMGNFGDRYFGTEPAELPSPGPIARAGSLNDVQPPRLHPDSPRARVQGESPE